jgi:adenylyltransferase/sulfurtransferase
MKNFSLTRTTYQKICSHALETFPDECCGLVVQHRDRQEIVRVTNVQNEKHTRYPESFPRTAATAYVMGPEALPALLAHERKELVVEAFYHSHPQREAEFSAEDRKRAMFHGEPAYPDVHQLVVSVQDGEVKSARAFRWNDTKRVFAETSLEVL